MSLVTSAATKKTNEHRPGRTGNPAKHGQRGAAVRGHEDDAASGRTVRFQARRRATQTRRHGLLAAGRVASLAGLEIIYRTAAGKSATLAGGIRRTKTLQRGEICNGRLPGVRT